MKYPKRSQYKYAKSRYRVRNWGEFEAADLAIEAALTIRTVFHLPHRQTEGFLRSLAELLEVDLLISDHTTLSRRLTALSDIQFRRLETDRPIHLLIDSTGLRTHIGANWCKPTTSRSAGFSNRTESETGAMIHPSSWTPGLAA